MNKEEFQFLEMCINLLVREKRLQEFLRFQRDILLLDEKPFEHKKREATTTTKVGHF